MNRLFDLHTRSKRNRPLRFRRRHKCPYYGFFKTHGSLLLDQNGNQCALIENRYVPCQMEKKGFAPNWNKCPLKCDVNSKVISELENEGRVFPREYMPEQKTLWKGISFRTWKRHVMNSGTKRPISPFLPL
jgi:hypothetical protein